MDIFIGLALLALTLYVSTLSFALRTYSRARFAERLGEARAKFWLERFDQHEHELQIAISILRLAAVLAVIIYAEFQYDRLVGADASLGTAITAALITLFVLLLIALGLAHALALHAGETWLATNRHAVWGLRTLLYPLSRSLLGVDFVVRRLLGKTDDPDEETERAEQEILEAISEGELHGAVDEEQKEMIESILELHETTVAEIMTPRTDIVAVPADVDFHQACSVIMQAGHSRVPVYDQSIDRIIGVLYAKDMIGLDPGRFDLRATLRTCPFVPETKTIDHLLREFRSAQVHIAIVLDEYGGTAGLVTIEDILEELVGEIADEYDREPPASINRLDDNTLEVDARVPVYEVNEELSIELPEDGDYDTIGGFVFSTLGRIPVSGDEFHHENIHIRVVDAEERRINRLQIHVERLTQPA